MATFQKRQYEELADAMVQVLNGLDDDMEAIARRNFQKLSRELKERNPNMDLDKFNDRAGI